MGLRRRRTLLGVLALVLVLAVAAAHPLWLPWIGEFLVRPDQPSKAEMIVVLAGDQYGLRILKACELVRAGYAPRALVSGPECCYGQIESELAIAFAARNGCPAEWFLSFPIRAMNTQDEIREIMPELRRRGVRRFLVVTSDYHTRRARAGWREVAPPNAFRIVASPDRYFRARDWWHDREAQKTVFLEWSKTVASWVGMGR